MAPSPGVCFLSFCITVLCDSFLEPAGEWRQWVPDPIDRKRRRLLTRSLNCGGGPLRVWDPLCGFKHSTWVQFHRRPRILLKYQRVTWGQGCRRRAKQRWSGWPLRGCRIGEASHPGLSQVLLWGASGGRASDHPLDQLHAFPPELVHLLQSGVHVYFAQSLDVRALTRLALAAGLPRPT